MLKLTLFAQTFALDRHSWLIHFRLHKSGNCGSLAFRKKKIGSASLKSLKVGGPSNTHNFLTIWKNGKQKPTRTTTKKSEDPGVKRQLAVIQPPVGPGHWAVWEMFSEGPQSGGDWTRWAGMKYHSRQHGSAGKRKKCVTRTQKPVWRGFWPNLRQFDHENNYKSINEY